MGLFAPERLSDLETRLAPFVERGLIERVPTPWQLAMGSIEMAPYVVLPDAGDGARYAGAPLGHPLARTPLVLSQIGWEHFRVGHGLDASLRALIRHLAYVYHEGMPVYDLQLVQTHSGGLDVLRQTFEAIESAGDLRSRSDKLLTSLVIPDAPNYRSGFLGRDGFIERAAGFEYEEPADFLRPEFFSVINFCNYCASRIEPEAPRSILAKLARFRRAAAARFQRSP